ncbi:hypothetical protein [Trichothermofontia sp.]
MIALAMIALTVISLTVISLTPAVKPYHRFAPGLSRWKASLITGGMGNSADTQNIERTPKKTAEVFIMQAPAFPCPDVDNNLEQVVTKILTTRCITRMDQAWLMSLLNKPVIEPQEHDLVNQVFQSLQQGRLRVV